MNVTGSKKDVGRREFLALAAASAGGLLLPGAACSGDRETLYLGSGDLLGELEVEAEGQGTLGEGARWYIAHKAGDGLTYRFRLGSLDQMAMLSSDFLLDGQHMIVFVLSLQEGEDGPQFHFRFSGLNQCSFRLRLPLNLIDQNRWGIEREGAFLKPRCSGKRIDLQKVDRAKLIVSRKSPALARWCMTPLNASRKEVPPLGPPLLPKGKLLDELGQSTLHQWPGQTKSGAEVVSRIRRQLVDAPNQAWPGTVSRWGGWRQKRVDSGTGFFRTHRDENRWWLVDPDGYRFWSAGLDCVRPEVQSLYDGLETALTWLPDPQGEYRDAFAIRPGANSKKTISYLTTNLIRSLGPQNWRDGWARIALAEMKRWRFNTVGNWSEWGYARKASFPYVRPLSFRSSEAPLIYRDFPDVYHPGFEQDAAACADQLKETVKDPALIGYFLMNEPTWGFSSELPAVGMLYNSDGGLTRDELSRVLLEKYSSDEVLSRAWKMEVSFQMIGAGRWKGEFSETALKDLEAFSIRMVERYFSTLSQACKALDPNHLNLGMRWAGPPPAWAVQGMKSFDVFSLNCYRQKLPREVTESVSALLDLPSLVGEWHFGALDAGLPSSGIGHVPNQQDRGRAYRVYLEDAAANPNCVGTHWFTLYDESALGRFDGENYNIGFLDICNRPYQELADAATASHERIYEVAAGLLEPYDDEPEYLPNLF